MFAQFQSMFLISNHRYLGRLTVVSFVLNIFLCLLIKQRISDTTKPNSVLEDAN